MPIRPEDRAAYGPDWPALSRSIRFERAGGRCAARGAAMDGGAAVKIIGWAAVTVDHGEIVDVAEYPAGQRSQAEEAVALWDGMDPIEENRSPTEQNLLVALVPVADLPEPVDVDAAVERAARAYFSQSHEGAWEDQPSPAWVAAACRDHVRPIVLAALGLSPDQP